MTALVARITPIKRTPQLTKKTQCELAEQRGVVGALDKKHDVAVKNIRSGLNPSKSAKSTNYFTHQGGVTPIPDGHYGFQRTPNPPPIELYHRIVASFQAVIRDEFLRIPPQVVLMRSDSKYQPMSPRVRALPGVFRRDY
ncbi:hypothetical protein F5146DRAFT_1163307 [Armillaria mellea]|nr:hypothetical protein F5146DRAFT_1163307 [Armillaria mellea]